MKKYPGSSFYTAEKDLIVYKKVNAGGPTFVLKMRIPKGTRFHVGCWQGGERKCRAECAVPLAFASFTGVIRPRPGVWRTKTGKLLLRSQHDRSYYYKIGMKMKPRYAFYNHDSQCASGIHFFMTFAEAADY